VKISRPTNRPRGSASRNARVASWSIVVSVWQPDNGVHVSTSTSTAGWGAKTDCITTDTIGKAINSSIARAVGRKNQKNVLCRIVFYPLRFSGGIAPPVGFEQISSETLFLSLQRYKPLQRRQALALPILCLA
jgi:hypothetical protein